jgi:general L-amino acid transport system permease protein
VIYKSVTGFVGWATTTAKWVVVTANLKVFMVGMYPTEQLWRIWIILALVALMSGISWAVWGQFRAHIAIIVMAVAAMLALGPIAMDSRLWFLVCGALVPAGYGLGRAFPVVRRRPILMWLLAVPVILLLIRGWQGSALLPFIGSNVWNGLLLTVMLAVSGIVLSFPLGVLLALGRRSNLPVIRYASILYIELIRGVPLVSLLYVGAYILPVFLPAEFRPDQFVRALTAVTLFSAAYLAENVRGGLQATGFIILPQALRAVIPTIVGQFIGLFKDTSLVAIVGLIDIVGIGQSLIANPDPNFLNRHFEVYVFVAAVYFVFSYTLSYASRRLERALGVGQR